MSKALEALERTRLRVGGDYTIEQYKLDYETIENALKEWKIWKEALETGDYDSPEKKALEIIKEKGIILQFIKETYTVEQYNAGVFGTLVKPLTQEEYDLLKEVFDE